jgi:hypothetical protein
VSAFRTEELPALAALVTGAVLAASTLTTLTLSRRVDSRPGDVAVLKIALAAEKTHRADAEAEVAALTSDKIALEKHLTATVAAYQRNRLELKETSDLLEIREARLAKLQTIAPEPSIGGIVLEIARDGGFVVKLSVGSEDGVETGFRFWIIRKGEAMGRVLVSGVSERTCVCRVIFTKSDGIKTGDAAVTWLQVK